MVGIREALEKEFPEADSERRPQEATSPTQSFDIVLFGVSSFAINPSIIEPPPESSIYILLNTYIRRVDPLYKIMHIPSLRTLLLAETNDLWNPLSIAASDALRFAVYFTALCTLDETECQDIFHQDKIGIRDRFRLVAEIMLSRANLQTTRDITVLQAFAVYLVSFYPQFSYLPSETMFDLRLDDVRAPARKMSPRSLPVLFVLHKLLDLMQIRTAGMFFSKRYAEGYGIRSAFLTCKQP